MIEFKLMIAAIMLIIRTHQYGYNDTTVLHCPECNSIRVTDLLGFIAVRDCGKCGYPRMYSIYRGNYLIK